MSTLALQLVNRNDLYINCSYHTQISNYILEVNKVCSFASIFILKSNFPNNLRALTKEIGDPRWGHFEPFKNVIQRRMACWYLGTFNLQQYNRAFVISSHHWHHLILYYNRFVHPFSKILSMFIARSRTSEWISFAAGGI